MEELKKVEELAEFEEFINMSVEELQREKLMFEMDGDMLSILNNS